MTEWRLGDRTMRRRLREVLGSVAFVCVWVASTLAGTPVQSLAPSAPPFSLPDLGGKTRTLHEFLDGRPLLLEFMSTDCPHCRFMGPVLARLHTTYRDRVTFLTVAFDRRAMRVRAFAQVHGHAWSYLLGNEETIRAYGLEGVPTFYVVGADGRIRERQVGSRSQEELAGALDAALRGP